MKLYSWEEKAYNELVSLYEKFYNRLAELGKECYRIDSHILFNNDVKDLTCEQEQLIRGFWENYVDDFDIYYHRYYIDRTGQFDVRFIPDDIFAGYIDGYLNNRTIEAGVSDKNYFDLYLNGFKMPVTYIHLINGTFEDSSYRIITRDNAIKYLVHTNRFIVKPSMASYGGKGCTLFCNPTYEEIDAYLREANCENMIFQEIVEQHKMTALLHPKSLNTIRIMTLLLDGEIKVLPAAFRIGVGESYVDNASKGGIYCKILPDGTLSNFAYDSLGNRFDTHPDGGMFSDIKFEFMDKVQTLVVQAAQRFPHFRLIGWDIAIDKESTPIIIEANLTMSSMDVIETICGPLFGEYTERVLDEIFHQNKKKSLSIDLLQYI